MSRSLLARREPARTPGERQTACAGTRSESRGCRAEPSGVTPPHHSTESAILRGVLFSALGNSMRNTPSR